MFKIGEFAQIAQVSVRLLHYYDKLGLLRPVYVNNSTGYRYYSAAQLPRLHRILALKDLGLSLEEVTALLDESISTEAIRGILLLKRAELQQRVEAEQMRLARVEARLSYIEGNSEPQDCEVVLKSVDPLTVWSIRQALQPGDGPAFLFRLINCSLRKAGLAGSIESILCLYHTAFIIQQHPELKPRRRLIEAIYAINPSAAQANPVINGRSMRRQILPGFDLVASTIYCGPDETRHLAARAMHRWITAHGYQLSAPVREVYLRRGVAGRPQDHITEIQLPIKKVDAVPSG